ncbi:MAG TPA: DM13 domain-containing protein, partial [Herpetosiphonaceae bacterium]|nr:DM13 domain-containing protein [Herpetosiphonaceae bacterium]
VYVVGAPDSYNAETVEAAGFVSPGMLKGNQGNQTYALPAEYDPALHRSVTIWCRRFAVNFVTAPLAAVE